MINEIDVKELNQMKNSGADILIVDVREEEERKCGFIPGSIHIPLAKVLESLSEIENNKKTYFYCRGGTRSANACTVLMQIGFLNVFNVKGGMLAWENANFATCK